MSCSIFPSHYPIFTLKCLLKENTFSFYQCWQKIIAVVHENAIPQISYTPMHYFFLVGKQALVQVMWKFLNTNFFASSFLVTPSCNSATVDNLINRICPLKNQAEFFYLENGTCNTMYNYTLKLHVPTNSLQNRSLLQCYKGFLCLLKTWIILDPLWLYRRSVILQCLATTVWLNAGHKWIKRQATTTV